MSNYDDTLLQKLMNEAYGRWQKNEWSQQDFWDQLDAKERIAVFVGNLNYQVENGGFIQWFDNNYATNETVNFLNRLFDKVGTETVLKVKKMMNDFYRVARETKGDSPWWHDDEGDEYDDRNYVFDLSNSCSSKFYEINEKFIMDVENYIQNL